MNNRKVNILLYRLKMRWTHSLPPSLTERCLCRYTHIHADIQPHIQAPRRSLHRYKATHMHMHTQKHKHAYKSQDGFLSLYSYQTQMHTYTYTKT